jgi:hypothetical protein
VIVLVAPSPTGELQPRHAVLAKRFRAGALIEKMGAVFDARVAVRAAATR